MRLLFRPILDCFSINVNVINVLAEFQLQVLLFMYQSPRNTTSVSTGFVLILIDLNLEFDSSFFIKLARLSAG